MRCRTRRRRPRRCHLLVDRTPPRPRWGTRAPAANRMSLIESTPSSVPSAFTTGSRRTRARLMVANAVSTSSSGLQVATFLVATAPTLTSEARAFRVASAMYMSRSVTTPTSSPSSTTGRMPQSPSHIRCAVAASVVSGVHVVGAAVISSLTFMTAFWDLDSSRHLRFPGS